MERDCHIWLKDHLLRLFCRLLNENIDLIYPRVAIDDPTLLSRNLSSPNDVYNFGLVKLFLFFLLKLTQIYCF